MSEGSVYAPGSSAYKSHPLTTESASEIQEFVGAFLRACNAAVKKREDGLWAVTMPGWLAERLGVGEAVLLGFDPALAGPDVWIIAHGSHLLDAMVQLARERGTVCDLICIGPALYRRAGELCRRDPWSYDVGGPDHGPSRQASRLFPGVRVRAIEHRLIHQQQIIFHFKVAYISDERVEEIITLLADPGLELVVPAPQYEPTLMTNLSTFRRASGTRARSRAAGIREADDSLSYATARLYRLACDALERLIETRSEQVAKGAEQRKENELRVLEEYYRGVAGELAEPFRRLLRRITAQRARGVLYSRGTGQWHKELQTLSDEAKRVEAEYRAELEALESDRLRRIEELQERFRLRIEVTLISMAKVLIPRIEWLLRLAGSARREVYVLYDLLSEAFIDPECERCGARSPVTLCRDGDLSCATCLD